MASQTYSNNASSILASGYTAGDSTITLFSGDGSKFPSSGDFMLAIDNPVAFYLKCTSRSGDVLTVTTTGQEGSTAASKASGVAVNQVLTAGAMDAIRAEAAGVILSGTSDPGLPSPSVMQHAHSGTNSCPYSSSVITGNLLVAEIATDNSSNVTAAVSDTLGNVWTLAGSVIHSGVGMNNQIWYCLSASSGANTVSFTESGSANPRMAIAEVSGVTATVDSHVENLATGPGACTLLTAYDYVICGLSDTSVVSVTVTGADATSIIDQYYAGSGRIVALAGCFRSGTGSYTMGINNTSSWSMYSIVAFKSVSPPSPGKNGDWYLNTTTGILWKKSGGSWSVSGTQIQTQQSLQTLTDASTIAWDFQLGNAIITLGGNRTMGNPTNLVSGAKRTLIVKQDSGGGRALVWDTDYLFPGGLNPAISGASNANNIFEFLCDGTHMLNTSQVLNVSAPLVAPQFANLVGWWRADGLSQGNGTPVSSWSDSSGNGNTATQATLSQQPTFNTNVLNGLPALNFTQSNHTAMSTGLTFSSQPLTIVLVYRTTSTSGNHRAIQSSTTNWLMGPYGGYHEAFNGNFMSSTAAVASNVWVTMTVTTSGSGTTLYINNGSVGSNGGITPIATVSFGYTSNFGEGFDGDVAEICIYNRVLNSTERSDLAIYIAAKYGI